MRGRASPTTIYSDTVVGLEEDEEKLLIDDMGKGAKRGVRFSIVTELIPEDDRDTFSPTLEADENDADAEDNQHA